MRTQEIVEAYGKTHIYMIGMDDNPQPKHIEVIIKNVKHDNIFSGGKRHYEIVKPFLPADAVKPFRSRHESVSLLQLIADVRTP